MKYVIPNVLLSVIIILAIFAAFQLLSAHIGADAYGLNWVTDYISQYAATLPYGMWEKVRNAMVATGLIVLLSNILVAYQTRVKKLGPVFLILGVVALGALSLVAFFPVERKVMPQPELSTFDKVWNILTMKETPKVNLPDRRESNKHHQTSIELALGAILASGIFYFATLYRYFSLRALLRVGGVYLLSASCFLYIGLNRDHSNFIGLAQRLGFILIYVWLLQVAFVAWRVKRIPA